MTTRPPTTPAPSRRASASAGGERAITLVEVLVVLLIIAIIGGIAVRSMGGQRSSGGAVKARVIALALSEAAAQFQRDHGGRVPGEPVGAGARDWDTSRRSPIDRSNGSAPYLKPSSSEALTTGAVSLESGSGALVGGGSASPIGRVRYDADTARNVFVVIAYAQSGGRLVPACWV